MTPKEAAFRLREWYQAFKNFGKGNELTVKEFLEAATLIESLAADLDTLRQFTVELSARNEELRNEKTTLALRVKQFKAERDAVMRDMNKNCASCKYAGYNNPGSDGCPYVEQCQNYRKWQWRGVQKEE